MKKLVLFWLFLFGLNVSLSLGCSLGIRPLTSFDETEYIFIGKVLGYTAPVKGKDLRYDVIGLIVRVKESVYLPKTPKSNFEVFPIQLWADCSISGTTLEEVRRQFPTNSEVRVIAKEAKVLPLISSEESIRLQQRPGELSSITLNTEKGNRMTSADSMFDYKSYKYDMDNDTAAKYLLPAFEVRKDLFRLKKAANRSDKKRILDRLFYAPISTDLDFHELFKANTPTDAEFKSYYESHFKMTDPIGFKQLKAYEEALAELIKLGYPLEVSEVALRKALEEGTDFASKTLVKESIKILTKNKN